MSLKWYRGEIFKILMRERKNAFENWASKNEKMQLNDQKNFTAEWVNVEKIKWSEARETCGISWVAFLTVS